MDRLEVTSSNIQSIGHDEKKSLLEIEFKTGAVYQYHPVTKETYLAIMASESIGGAFHKLVKSQEEIKFKKMD